MAVGNLRSPNPIMIIGLLMLLSSPSFVSAVVECTTVSQLFAACSTFITYGSPDPLPGTPCCDAMSGLNIIATSSDNRQSVCRCLMSLIVTYNPNATAIATLPGFCGVSLGFTIDPNTDCSFILQEPLVVKWRMRT